MGILLIAATRRYQQNPAIGNGRFEVWPKNGYVVGRGALLGSKVS